MAWKKQLLSLLNFIDLKPFLDICPLTMAFIRLMYYWFGFDCLDEASNIASKETQSSRAARFLMITAGF